MPTAPATDSAVQFRARRIAMLVMTAGVVGPILGIIVGRITGTGSIFSGPGPIVHLRYVTPAVVFAVLPFVGLAVLTYRSVCKQGRLSAFWIGACVGGLVFSILFFAVLVSDLEILILTMLGGFCLRAGLLPMTRHSLTMLLGGAIGWILGRAISWFRRRAA